MKIRYVSYFLFVYLFIWLLNMTFIMGSFNYTFLKNSIPFLLYFLANLVKVNIESKRFYQLIAFLSLPMFFTARKFCFLEKSLPGFFFIEYILFSIFYFELFTRKVKNDLKAFSLTLMALIVAGFFYEMPIFRYQIFPLFSFVNPFLIHTPFVMASILLYYFRFHIFKEKTVMIATFFLILFDIYYFWNPGLSQGSLGWFVRLPTLVYVLFLIYKWKKTE